MLSGAVDTRTASHNETIDGAFRTLAVQLSRPLFTVRGVHVAWLGETTLVFDSYGSGQTGDALYTLHRGDPSAREIYRARKPFAIGALRCSYGAFTRCLATVSEPSLLIDIAGDLLHHSATATEHSAADITGLPLRDLGIFGVTTP